MSRNFLRLVNVITNALFRIVSVLLRFVYFGICTFSISVYKSDYLES